MLRPDKLFNNVTIELMPIMNVYTNLFLFNFIYTCILISQCSSISVPGTSPTPSLELPRTNSNGRGRRSEKWPGRLVACGLRQRMDTSPWTGTHFSCISCMIESGRLGYRIKGIRRSTKVDIVIIPGLWTQYVPGHSYGCSNIPKRTWSL